MQTCFHTHTLPHTHCSLSLSFFSLFLAFSPQVIGAKDKQAEAERLRRQREMDKQLEREHVHYRYVPVPVTVTVVVVTGFQLLCR